jgi:AcrR family transcriptional regulator
MKNAIYREIPAATIDSGMINHYFLTEQSVTSGERQLAADREPKQRNIIRAALKLFARGGFEATSVDDIAREAGYGKGTLYLYFKDKEDLYYHTLLAVFEAYEQAIRGCIGPDVPPAEILESIAAGMIAFFAGNRDTFRLLHTMSGPGSGPLKQKLMEPVRNKIDRLLAFEEEVIERGKKEGAFRTDIPSRDMVHGFTGMVNFAMQSLLFSGPAEPLDAARRAEVIMRIFLEGVARTEPAREFVPREGARK